MSKRKPFEIIIDYDGRATLIINGMRELFKDMKTIKSFAEQLSNQISDRRTGIFHLQDNPDGTLEIHMHKTGHIIKTKDYDQASKFAEMVLNETSNI